MAPPGPGVELQAAEFCPDCVGALERAIATGLLDDVIDAELAA